MYYTFFFLRQVLLRPHFCNFANFQIHRKVKISLVDPRKGRSSAPAHSYIRSLKSEPALPVPELAGRVLTVNLPRCRPPTARHCVLVSRSPDSGCLRSSDLPSGAGGLHPVPTQWMLRALTHRKSSSHVPRTDD